MKSEAVKPEWKSLFQTEESDNKIRTEECKIRAVYGRSHNMIHVALSTRMFMIRYSLFWFRCYHTLLSQRTLSTTVELADDYSNAVTDSWHLLRVETRFYVLLSEFYFIVQKWMGVIINEACIIDDWCKLIQCSASKPILLNGSIHKLLIFLQNSNINSYDVLIPHSFISYQLQIFHHLQSSQRLFSCFLFNVDFILVLHPQI